MDGFDLNVASMVTKEHSSIQVITALQKDAG